MWEFLNILVGGVVTGAVYALLALGYSLVFRVSGALNLAQGAFVVGGALTMYTFEVSHGMSAPVAFLAALASIAATVAVVEWTVVRPALQRISHANVLMMMGGLLTAFQGLAFLIWGSVPYSLPPFSGYLPIHVGGLFVARQAIWVIGAAAVSVAVLAFVMSRTTFGKAMQATAENRMAAGLVGVNTDRMILIAFVAAAMLGVIAGAVTSPITSIDYGTMSSYTTQGLIAVSLGGLGSIYGSVAGGLLLGVMQALLSGYVSSLFSTAISLLVLIAIIVLRPQGLLGRTRGARADVAARGSWKVYSPPRMPRPYGRVGAVGLVAVMLVLPHLLGPGDMRAADITGCFCLTVVGLDLLTGVAGQVSLGQAAFMAVGGYVYGILAIRAHVTPIFALLCGVAASALVAAVLGAVSARLRGMYLAIATLAFGILGESVASGLNITGGPSGLVGIPVFSVAGYAFDTNTRFYYLIWSLVAVSLLLVGNLVRSGRGRVLRAMNGDDIGARSLGLRTPRAKVTVFVISACLASIAGSLYAAFFRYLSPDQVGSGKSLELITMLVIGGMATQIGPLFGVALLIFLPLESQSFANYAPMVTGILLVLFLRYLPGGMYGALLDLAAFVRRRLRRPAGPAQPVAPRLPAPVAAGARLNGSSPARLLRVQGLCKSFGGVQAVHDVSFDVGENTICALIGPNGAGKSTVFNLITNLYRPDAGEVTFLGRSITGMSSDRIAECGLFRTFQTSRVFPQLTVLENVLVGGFVRSRAGYLSQALSLPAVRAEEAKLEAAARGLLDVLHLSDRADDPVSDLSFAGHKYVELARALMARPKLLLLDEPGAGMNDAETEELSAALGAVRDLGYTILVVEHNMTLVMGIADQVVVMDAGRLIATGPPAQIQQEEVVIDAYFGRAEVAV